MKRLFDSPLLRAVFRSCAIAVLVYLAACGGDLIEFFFLCHKHELAEQSARGEPVVAADSGFGYARPFDEILLCHTQHCLRSDPAHPIACHEDLSCLCVEASVTADPKEMQRRFSAHGMRHVDCTVDKAHPTRDDATGACRYAHCNEHLTP